MTPLKTFILESLYRHGAMLDVYLWQLSTECSMSPITQACLELKQEGFIDQPDCVRPVSHEWRLTKKGRDHVAAQAGQRTTISAFLLLLTPPADRGALALIAAAVPYVLCLGAVLAMLISALWRYNERFREFWARTVCAFMERHTAVHSCNPQPPRR
jgi:hypothetical protein